MHRSYLYPHNPFTLRPVRRVFFCCKTHTQIGSNIRMPLSRLVQPERATFTFICPESHWLSHGLFAAAGTVFLIRIAANIRHTAFTVLHKMLELILK